MSIGNLKDSGNQGNNFPWQLRMLLGQQCACDQLTEIAGNTDQVEFLLTAILTTLQSGTEYEAKFVLDTCDANKIYLEVRVWNTDTGTWGPITYYIPGSSTPVTPTGEGTPGCLQYADPTAVLGLILAELQTQTVILTDIDNNTDNLETQLAAILTAYSAGQQACASSFSVTLCTEQGTNLANIDTSTSNALTELLAQGITLDSLETLITSLNAVVATEATLASVLAELQAINIDTDGLSQEATQLLVLAAINTVISNTTGLSTEVTLNALLTAFNAEDFATETTLNSLLTAFNAEDFATETTLAALNLWVQGNAATETTLQSVLTELQGINIDTNGLSQETTQLLVLAALNSILADTANLDVPLSTVATEVTLQSVLTALTNIATSGLATEATLLALFNAFTAEDFATETTLALIEAITSQMTFTGGDLNVSANIQVGGTDVSAANPVPVSLPSGVQSSRYVRTTGVGPINILAGATSVSVLNTGGNNITVDTGLGPEILEPGISIGWRAREGRNLGAFTIAGTTGASEFVYTAVI